MAWQQNQRLADLFMQIEQVNKKRKDDEISLQKALELNSIHHQMLKDMHNEMGVLKHELNSFKQQLTEHAALSLKSDMEKYANILAIEKLQISVNHYLDSNLENRVLQILTSRDLP